MKDITKIKTWKQGLGLLPIHLNPNNNNSDYVMLNGGYGDFCLQTINDNSEIDKYFSKSWSSNTKNFLVLDDDNVKIYNWSKTKPETIPKELVLNNFDKFYNYLLSKSYKSSKDVVPYIIDIFRQFRNITQERTEPIEALNLLFILLSSLEDDVNNFNFTKWNIPVTTIPASFDNFINQIKEGNSNIKPNLDIIIRHSAGILFQEAQKEVLFFNPQRDLFGGISGSLSTKKELYSSIHYTPPFLSRTIVENALRQVDKNNNEIKIFDPSCGSSEFLIEALKQLKQLEYSGNIKIIGWDTSETAINTSRFLLEYEKRTIWNNKLNFSINLVDDSLTEVWENDYDLILMNPPFVSWELLKNKDSRETVRNTLGINFKGKPNQASAFFYKSINHLNTNGVIGCVIPSSLLSLDSYKKLRDEVYETIDIKLLGKLGNFVFEDALTDVSIIIAQKPKTHQVPTILWTRNEKGIAKDALRDLRKLIYSNEITLNNLDYSIFKPMDFPVVSESWKPISFTENEFYKTLKRFQYEGKLVNVQEIFNVKQGVNTGYNKLFKIKESEYQKYDSLEKSFFRPVVDNSAIENGKLIAKSYVWYPYDEKGLIIKTEEQFKHLAQNYYEKLYPFKDKLSVRSRKNELSWWHLSEYRNWLLKSELRLVSSRFGNSDSFALDIKGSFIVENGSAWLPKKDFIISDYYFYLSVFSSSIFDKMLSIYSKQLSGGNWFDLGRKYSQNIPIPNIHSLEVKESVGYNKLVQIGKELSNGNTSVRVIADDILTKYFYPNNC